MAARGTFVRCNFHPTTTSSVLTPTLPYPATLYDAILNDYQLSRCPETEGLHCGLMKMTMEIQLTCGTCTHKNAWLLLQSTWH